MSILNLSAAELVSLVDSAWATAKLRYKAGDYDESKHPRDDNGQWSSTGGGGGGPSAAQQRHFRRADSLDRAKRPGKTSRRAKRGESNADYYKRMDRMDAAKKAVKEAWSAKAGEYDESKHPRDDSGRWSGGSPADAGFSAAKRDNQNARDRKRPKRSRDFSDLDRSISRARDRKANRKPPKGKRYPVVRGDQKVVRVSVPED